MPSAQQGARREDVPSTDEFLGAYAPEVQKLAHSLRRVVAESVPGAIERVSIGWRLIGYRAPDGRRSHYFCYVAPLADSVRLGFEYGVLLADQAKLEGDGSQVRFVTVRAMEAIDAEQLAPLIAEAAMLAVTRRRG